MRLRFAHGGPEGAPFRVPEERLLEVPRPRMPTARSLDEQVEAALDDPLAAPRLDEAARTADRILLLVDDATRSTPTRSILGHIARRLEQAGVQDGQVTLLVAQGTHRPLTAEEIDQKIGPLASRWTLEQHDGRDPDRLFEAGRTRDGMPVVVNRLITNHDLVIGIGIIGVHGLMGYSGGAKIATIGAGGEATERWTHWQAATRYETRDLLGVVDNPLRRNLDEAARMVGLDAVLNVVMDPGGRVHRTAYGDPLAAHRALVPKVQELHTVRIAQQADVVVVDAHPATRDYWQAVKGLYVAELVAREGGSIVLVAAAPEGVAQNHPNLVDLAGLAYADIVDAVDRGEVGDVIGAAIAAYTARLRRRARIHLVSSGIAPQEARALGLEPAADVQDALDQVLSTHGPRARVAILEGGGALLPVVGGVNDDIPATPRSRRAVQEAR